MTIYLITYPDQNEQFVNIFPNYYAGNFTYIVADHADVAKEAFRVYSVAINLPWLRFITTPDLIVTAVPASFQIKDNMKVFTASYLIKTHYGKVSFKFLQEYPFYKKFQKERKSGILL